MILLLKDQVRWTAYVAGMIVAALTMTPTASLERRQPTVATVVPGTTEGQASASPDGSSNFSVTIQMPPGTAGMQPKIYLAYSHRGGMTSAGLGWGIGGLSAIQRGTSNLEDEGEVRGVTFDERDALLLDGEKLVLSAPPDNAMREFRARVDSYSRIRAYQWSTSGPERFVVETRAGLKMFYGSTPDSRVRLAGGSTLKWLCDRVEDRSGNYMTFTYAMNGLDYRITRIDYTGNVSASLSPYASLRFEYEQTTDPYQITYVTGERIESRFRLAAIDTMYGERRLRRYALTHSPADEIRPTFRLTSLTEFGVDGRSFRPLTFTYSDARPDWREQQRLSLPVELSQLSGVRLGFRILDVNGDGRRDVLFRVRVGSEIKKGAFINNGTRWVENNRWEPPVDLADERAPNDDVTFADVDGDGLVDLVVGKGHAEAGVYLNSSAGWRARTHTPPIAFTVNGKRDGRFLFLDIDPANHNGEELLFRSAQGAGAFRFSSGGWVDQAALHPPEPFNVDAEGTLTSPFKIDANCDGRADLAFLRRRQNGTIAATTYEVSSAGVWSALSDPFALPFAPVPHHAAVRFPDLDGNGCADALVAYEMGGQRTAEAFFATNAGWLADARQLPSAATLWRSSDSVRLAEVGDLDGDRRDDVFWNISETDKAAFLGRANTWQSVPTLAPPLVLPTGPSRPNLFHVVSLSASSPRLIYTDVPNEPLRVFRATALQWRTDPNYTVPVDVAQFDKVDTGVRFFDVNADGYADLLYARRRVDGVVEKKAFIFTPGASTPWVEDERHILPVVTFSENLKELGTALVDVTGDGATDLLVAYRESKNSSPVFATYENCSRKPQCRGLTGESAFWKRVAGFEPPALFADGEIGQRGARTVDVNGDGLTDLVLSRLTEEWKLEATTYLNRQSSWEKVDTLAAPFEFTRPLDKNFDGELPPFSKMRDNRVELIDLNADRLPDLLFHYQTLELVDLGGIIVPTAAKVIKKGAFLNTGTSWVPANDYTPPKRIDSDDNSPYRQSYFEDLNQDGLVDLVYVERDPSASRSESYLNTGRGWSRHPAYDIPAEAVFASKNDQGFRFMDVNADGYTDVVYRYVSGGNDMGGSFINTGIGWRALQDATPPLAFTEEGRGDLGVRPLDFNGDASSDLAQSYVRAAGEQRKTVYLNVTDKPDLLVKIENGIGATTTLAYRSALALGGEGLDVIGTYTAGTDTPPAYPIIDAPMPGHVVVAMRFEGVGLPARMSRYRYAENRLQIRQGTPLGFARQEAIDETRGRTTRIEYSQADGLVGSVVATSLVQHGTSPQLISEANTTWTGAVTLGVPLPSGFKPKIYRAQLTKMQSRSLDLTGTQIGAQTDDFEYDAFGNATRIRTVYVDGSGSETINTYADSVDRWLLARLETSTVTSSALGKPALTRRASFTYEPETGLLASEVALVGTAKALTTTYTRDHFGNKATVTTASAEPDSDRQGVVEYDNQGRFIISSKNALGHETRTEFDPVTGQAINQTDANGVRTAIVYDPLGRTIETTSATGNRATTEFRFPDTSSPAGTAYSVVKRSDGLPPVQTFFDGENRVMLTRTTGAGGRTVESVQQYDSLGRTVRTSAPYYVGDPVFFMVQEYDALDRQTALLRPDGTTIRTTYSGFTTTVTDAENFTTITTNDARGRRRETLDAKGGRTVFHYDAVGRPTSTIDALGQTASNEYDEAGCLIRKVDPTAGEWRYICDAYGQIASQTDPRGYTTAMRYDKLGRLLDRTRTDGVDRWTYDQTQYGVGRLASVISANGATKTFRYDVSGLEGGQRVSFGKDVLDVNQDYDAHGRPTVRQYSTGVLVRNVYDEYGLWTRVEVEDDSGVTVAWRGERFDAAGRVNVETFGNGITSTRVRDARTARLTSIQARSSVAPLQDLALEYDPRGNVRLLTDSVQNVQREFGYDELSRLLQESRGAQLDTQTYDALGNIVNKTGVGTYVYCNGPMGGRRLCRVEDTAAHKTTDLQYDAAGNVIRFGKLAFTFDTVGRTTGIRLSAFNYSKFEYSADGELIRQESRRLADKFVTVTLGDLSIVREEFAPPVVPTPERTRFRHQLSSPNGALGFYERTYWHYPVRYVAPPYGHVTFRQPDRSTLITRTFGYFHTDHLGSVRLVTDESAGVIDRADYDAWGRRVGDRGSYIYRSVKTGFTGHEHLDNVGLIHMRGRIYSPALARFLSADPIVQAPEFSQAHNRYSYVFNNPLRLIDPTGFGIFDAIGDFFSGVGSAIVAVVDAVFVKPIQWIGEQLAKVGRWIGQNWKTIVIVAASIAMTAVGIPPVLAGALIGGAGSALNGGSLGDILKGAVIGALTAQMFNGVGDMELTGLAAPSAHGVVGGVSSVMQGGDFGQGFATAFVTRGMAPGIEQLPTMGMRVAAAAVCGGVVSEIGGGSFENGAITATFSRLFNDELHVEQGKAEWVDDNGKVVESWETWSGDPQSDAFQQHMRDHGPIPEGEWIARQAEYQEMPLSRRAIGFFGQGSWAGGIDSWGEQRVWLHPAAGTETYKRGGFTMHGGATLGSRGCIDFGRAMPSFAARFRAYGKDLKVIVKYPGGPSPSFFKPLR